ncbi:MAG: hypothetical protein CSA62_00765 [Planctomycetota bacterium]|nr:MAG: hypothetical protein CSA62_00765 [Planctomycetota bacterium]
MRLHGKKLGITGVVLLAGVFGLLWILSPQAARDEVSPQHDVGIGPVRKFEGDGEVDAFLKSARKPSRLRVQGNASEGGARKREGHAPPVIAFELDTTGPLDERSKRTTIAKYQRIAGQLQEDLIRFRQGMDATKVDDQLKEAQLLDRVHSFAAMASAIRDGAYFTTRKNPMPALRLKGYRFYFDSGVVNGRAAKLVIPVSLADHPNLQLAMDYRSSARSEVEKAQRDRFNLLPFEQRRALVELVRRYKSDSNSLSSDEKQLAQRHIYVLRWGLDDDSFILRNRN